MKKFFVFLLFPMIMLCLGAEKELDLSNIKYKIVYESYSNNNWDIYIINADGSNKKNITNTPNIHEMYPKVSPNGKKIAFVVDTGEERNRGRDLYLMNIDGSNRRLIAQHGRQPCWSPDGKYIAFTKSESTRRFSLESWSTKGLFFYNMQTGKITVHPEATLEHLYNLCWSPDGQYIIATVLGGMGFKHTNIAIEVKGSSYFELNVTGCRPEFSPRGKYIGWGPSDRQFNIAKIDLSKRPPVADKDKIPFLYVTEGYEVYHLDWSPDGKYIAFSFGPDGEQNVGGMAPGWNICVAEVATGRWKMITFDGNHNKEPDWVP
jgi:Tol biopolymer transport system component